MDHEEAYHMQVDMDSLTISLKEQEDRFTLSESDYCGLNVPTLNINNDEDAKRWAELMAEEAESEVVTQPVKTLSQKEWNELFVKGKWAELTPQKSQSEMIIIPQRTLSQKAPDVKLKDAPISQKTEWSDCDSDGLFSDDEDEIDLMDYINPITNRKRVKIVDSDEEDDNKLVQLKPKVTVDLTKEVTKAKADLEGIEDESKDKKARQVMRWCFTMNNPELTGEELAEKLKSSDNVKGFVFQLEVGANGTEHFQGYLEFKGKQKMSAVKKLIGENPHMEAANGDKESNLKYCTKEEGRKEGPWTWGTLLEKKNGNQGKRSDLNDFAMMIEEYGGITDEVMQAFPGHALQFRRQAKERTEEIVMKLAKEKEKAWWMEQKRLKDAGLPYLTQRQMKCIMLFGPTAVGKTTHVKLETLGMGEDLYEKAGNNKWYPGYAGEKHMLVDEMTTGFCEKDIRNFNKMTNLGMNVQEVKGSHVLLDVETAWFTTNKHPLHIWDEVKESGTYKAFIRRFDEVHWWNDQKKLVILKNPGSKDDADDEAQWKKDYTRWMSFWNGKQLDDEHRTIVPGQEVKNYFTFGCNQPQANILDMIMF